MVALSKKQSAALEQARTYFLRGDRHPMLIQFRQKVKRDFAYYYGDMESRWTYGGVSGRGQWLERHLALLQAKEQTPITVNMIKRKINTLIGAEVSSRRRIAYRSHLRTPENNELAKALTYLGYYIQESQDFQHKCSRVFRDMNVCGMGWLNLFQEKGVIHCQNVSVWDMIPDMDDLSPDLTSMRFVGRKHWVDTQECTKRWKAFKHVLDGTGYLQEGSRSSQYDDLQGEVTNIDTPLSGDGSVALLCEVQYKEDRLCYEGVTEKGYPFTTFDEEVAERVLDPHQPIDEKMAKQTLRALFCGSVLLEYAPLEPEIVNMEGFSYIPAVYDRIFETGLFDGLVSLMIPSATDINLRRAKGLHLLNSVQKLISGVSNTQDNKELMELAKGTDLLFFVDKNVKSETLGNSDMGHANLKMYEMAKKELEEETGIHPEMEGDTTGKNQSGIAISRLQNASLRSQNLAFDSYTLFKKRAGRLMANILQTRENLLVLFGGDNDDEQTPMVLNSVEENVDGSSYMANDIRGMPFAIYVEETGDFASSFEETKSMILEMMQNPNAQMYFENEALLERLGFREAKEIVESSLSFHQRQAQAQAMAKASPQQPPQ